MAGGSSVLGILGAVLVLFGLVLAGSGMALQASAEQMIINCQFPRSGPSCVSTTYNAENTTVAAEYMTGTGLILAGVGFFLVALTVVMTMARRTEPPRWMSTPTPGATAAPSTWPPPPPPSG